MTAIIILTIAVIAMAIQNRRLSLMIAALANAQEETQQRVDRLSKTSKKTTYKQRQFDRKLEQQRKKQARLAKDQERIRKEQTRQSETIRKTEFKLAAALTDIQTQTTRLTQLYALLDCAQRQQAGSIPGSRQDISAQRQIISLENQIATCEKRIAKAEFDAQEARVKIAA